MQPNFNFRRLKQLRKSDMRKPTQETIAKIIGITRATYGKKETGKVATSIEDLRKLAAYYEVELTSFFSAQKASNTRKPEPSIKGKEKKQRERSMASRQETAHLFGKADALVTEDIGALKDHLVRMAILLTQKEEENLELRALLHKVWQDCADCINCDNREFCRKTDKQGKLI